MKLFFRRFQLLQETKTVTFFYQLWYSAIFFFFAPLLMQHVCLISYQSDAPGLNQEGNKLILLLLNTGMLVSNSMLK